MSVSRCDRVSVNQSWGPAGAYAGFSDGGGGCREEGRGCREGGGGVPRSTKEANNPNKRATELKPRTCAHQGSMFRP